MTGGSGRATPVRFASLVRFVDHPGGSLMRSLLRGFLFLACSAALLSSHRPALATSLVPVDLAGLARASDRIVLGTVTGAESRWNEDRSLIVTDVRIRVADAMKGNAAGEITVTQPGGIVGKLKVEVPGASAYRVGEEVVLFLAPERDGRTFVNALDRGRFPVVEDPVTRVKKVAGLTPEALRIMSGAGVAVDAQAYSTGSMPVERFVGGMKSLVRDLPAREGN